MDTITIDKRLIPFLLQLPARQVWMDYDAEGDVLYLSFAMPQQATDSVMGEDGNVYPPLLCFALCGFSVLPSGPISHTLA